MTDTEKESESATIPTLIESDEGADGSSMYKYRDFSNVNDEELEQQTEGAPASPPPPSTARGSVESSIRVQKFPVKLYAILAQKEFQEIITWMPHGRSWKVLKPNLFESLVMPLFFEYSNYHSFNRLVNAWSFRRISSGPDRGSYYHELFLRGRPNLQKYMRRLPKTHKKLPMKKEDEPDFYRMDKANPLPTLEEVPLPPSAMMPQVRQQQQRMPPAATGMLPGPMMGQIGGAPAMSAFKEFEPRDPFMGLAGQRAAQGTGLAGPAAGMNVNGFGPAMNGIGGAMNGMAPMNGMVAMNGLGGMGGVNGMNPVNGMNQFRDGGHFGAPGAANAMGNDFDQFQRLRQLQQMQQLELQMSGGAQVPGLGNDTLARMQAENSMNLRLSRQPC